ncbi:alanine racemase [Ornithinibacter aureus]|uniref:Alanine racemase n=1 Tax=Ornithinibacter aureus TaxID=622664 RepID=A0ABP8JM43_9MICO
MSIDLDAIRDNVAELVRRAAPAQVLAVVKADAYGHGLVDSARAALAGGASWLGVAQLAEALRLREAGVTAPLLTWLFAPGADIGGAIDADIEVTVGSMWSVDAVLAAARERGAPARIQVKVDTGLGRGGILTDWPQMVARLAAAHAEGAVEVTGVWSHFAWADAPQHPTVRAQQVRFEEACEELARAGVRPPLRHLANSAATLTNPSAHFDLVRPGLAVYGLSPVPDLGDSAHFGLREAMRVTARLSLVKRAAAGQGVSYGHEYVTDRDTVLGLVPMGYADGIPRAAGGAGPVLVGGRRLTIAGRVCMDQVVLDLGPDFAGAAGDEVVVLGRAADGEPSAQDWAQAAGTINYEIVTRMSPRLPRVLLGGPF